MTPAGDEHLPDRAPLIRSELERMLSSAEFRQSARMQRFLRLVVESALNADPSRLKESVIGVEVFDRPPDYDPKAEPIVRTEAHRLREKLRKYYDGEGVASPVCITLPKGGYAPAFEFRGPALRRPAERLITLPGSGIAPPPAPRRIRGLVLWSILGAAVTAAAVLTVSLSRKPSPAASLAPLTSFPGVAFRPSLSPDGQRVAFVWDGGSGNFDIYVKQVNLGDPLRLTTNPAQDLDPAWSPDGKRIAFLRRSPERQELIVVPAMGGAERKIADISARQTPWAVDAAGYVRSLGPAWSPDGRWIAVADASSPSEPDSIYLIGVESGAKRRLTVPGRSDEADSGPAFSWDGNRLAFVRWRPGAGGSPTIYIQSIKGGEPRQVTFDHHQLAGIAWSADDRRIIFSSDRGGEFDLWQFPVSGGQPVPVGGVVGMRGQHPSVSRDGRQLAFTERTYSTSIWRAPLGRPAAAPAALLRSSRADDSAQYSPDGRRILFISNRQGPRQIWISDADGGNAAPVASLPNVLPGTPRWSPDGARIVFDSKHEGFGAVYVIGADGAGLRRLTPADSSSMMASWSHDGKWVYYASDRSGRWEIWKQPVPDGPAVQITRNGGREAKEANDGRTVYYFNDAGGGASRLWSVPAGGGPETPVIGLDAFNLARQWALTADGIYYVSRTPAPVTYEMIFYDFATRQTRRLFRIPNPPAPGTSGLSISPDGRWVLYSQVEHQGSNVMLLQNFD